MNSTVLETGRLLLRPWSESDLDAYAAICAEPEVMRFLGGRPFSRMEAWRHMAFLIGHWSLRGFGHWAVEEKASGRLIGRLGFLQPADYPGFEIGWTLARDSWGKGYATEGARAALEHGFDALGKDHVISLIAPGNGASIRIAERLGQTLEATVEVMGHQALQYGMSKASWMARRPRS